MLAKSHQLLDTPMLLLRLAGKSPQSLRPCLATNTMNVGHSRYRRSKELSMRCFRPILPLVVALMLPAVPSPSLAQTGACGPSDAEAVGITTPVTTPPPALPVYTQPPIPEPGYM